MTTAEIKTTMTLRLDNRFIKLGNDIVERAAITNVHIGPVWFVVHVHAKRRYEVKRADYPEDFVNLCNFLGWREGEVSATAVSTHDVQIPIAQPSIALQPESQPSMALQVEPEPQPSIAPQPEPLPKRSSWFYF
jgi:hypothetical protein